MRSSLSSAWIVAAVLIAAGFVTSILGQRAWNELRADLPVLKAGDVEAAAGEGVMVGLLGGFRAVIADFLWVRTNAVWEDQDLPGAQTLIRLVTAVDSRPLMFWVNGARMIAYDMPVWRLDAVGGDAMVPASVRQRIEREQAEAGMMLLHRGLTYHPDEPLLLIEIGNILQRRLGDEVGGAEYYRRAALQPGAPHYAARIYAELLKNQGRLEEAYRWLVELHPRLRPDDPFAMPDLVLGRIRELEEKLHVPAGLCYAPRAGTVPAGVPANRTDGRP